MSLTLADVVVAAALAAIAAGLVLDVRGLRDRRLRAVAMRFHVAGAALALLVMLWFASRFLLLDLSYENVWLYTRTGLPWWYRLAGTWTSQAGSLLLWAADLAIVLAVMAWLHHRREAAGGSRDGTGGAPDAGQEQAWTRIFLAAIAASFLLAVLLQDTFAATSDFLLRSQPGGNGINPTLQSPFMLIHPPLMFVAYSLAAVPAAAGLGHMAVGHGRWSRVAGTWARVDWITYTFAMGLGGLWAYYTLGFGGYWAWDPVEVANFLPWLALTAYLHAQRHHLRYGSYAAAGPILAVLPWLLTLFSTVSTRSGLWISVHAFTDPTNAFNPDAAGRFLDILQAEPSLRFYVGSIIATLLLALGLWARRTAAEQGHFIRYAAAFAAAAGGLAAYAILAPQSMVSLLFEKAHILGFGNTGYGLLGLFAAFVLAAAAPIILVPDQESSQTRLDRKSLVATSVLLLLLALALLWVFHMRTVNGWSQDFYESRVPWLGTPFALALIVLLTRRDLGARNAFVVAGAALTGAIAALFLEGLGAYALVLSLVVALASVYKMWKIHGMGLPTRHRIAGLLLWLGAVLDLVFWINPPSHVGVPGAWMHLPWPVQIPGAVLSLTAIWGAHRIWLARAPPRPWLVFLLVGLLGAYYIAPLLALAAWFMARKDLTPRPIGRKAWRTPAVYGIHFLVAVVFLGYTLSTYYGDQAAGELQVEGSDLLSIGPWHVAAGSVDLESEAGRVDDLHVHLLLHAGGDATDGPAPNLYWEPQTGSYYPLPATHRTWTGDIYASLAGFCTDPEGDCGAGDWINAYQPTRQAAEELEVSKVRVQVHTLPGLGLLWAALVGFPFYVALLMRGDPLQATAQDKTPNRGPA